VEFARGELFDPRSRHGLAQVRLSGVPERGQRRDSKIDVVVAGNALDAVVPATGRVEVEPLGPLDVCTEIPVE
jgi:hypothetical protein